ncbi:hypothetical protein [Brucella pseudogrignonensis]|uniref:hypothetical protein n=1 Tax=Brucella pseudogrignonensis TaxID=419475 RepID=UPI000CFCEA37|nr:hypothetical protein [Brucella pseudogrignonensis]MQP38763.1 hypothetical protein [Ochrobactrum sp. MYb237]PQZ43382.1 hypothetical protein CQ059_05480 [Brucella pseudogrignonensis]PRA43129.1 hypothetical protein CQ063_01965 [Brucella pseudogrignonensis]PRA72401.1 hypothetical protein CQ055_03615 [Brucella pseudogrignonensis]
MIKQKKAKQTKADLRRKVTELTAQLASTYHFADAELHKSGGLMGSGVLLQLTALGGREIINPVVIRDGLSPATIAAIRADIERSFETAIAFKPGKAKKTEA